MENVSVFDIGGGKAVAIATDDVVVAAAEQAVPCRKDARLSLRVCNANAAAAAVVRLKAGSGPCAVLGDRDVTVGAGETAYIALFDTARFKQLSTGTVTVQLVDEDGDPLGAQALESIVIEEVQM